MLAWFPSDMTPEVKDANTKKLEQFAKNGLEACSELQAIDLGWGLENDFPVRGGAEGERGNMVTMLLGWPSIDAHMRFRDSDAFKDSIHLIRSLELMKKLTMFHVKTQVLENETRKQ